MKRKVESQRKVLIIYTGGTIGMVNDPVANTLKPVNFSNIVKEIPELKKFNYTIDAISFKPVIDSSNFSPAHWIRLCELIHQNYDNYNGFVILHGTDTLAYSASALSYMLENLSKPVVLTGSQLPVKEIRTDAPENLITAIEIAAAMKDEKPLVPEVSVYFDYMLFRGNRVSKFSSSKFEAFISANYPPLAEAGVDIKYNTKYIRKLPKGNLKIHLPREIEVGVMPVFPGITPAWVDGCLNANGLKALILETYGSGNATTSKWFLDRLKGAIDDGMLILNISQCPAGKVTQGKYATSKALRDIGVLGGADMTREAAVTKIIFLLGSGMSVRRASKLVSNDLRGELTG